MGWVSEKRDWMFPHIHCCCKKKRIIIFTVEKIHNLTRNNTFETNFSQKPHHTKFSLFTENDHMLRRAVILNKNSMKGGRQNMSRKVLYRKEGDDGG